MSERYTVKVAVMILVEKDNRILLGRRKNTPWENGKYNPPSGHVEEFETPLDAAVRETKEEVNIKINKEDLKFVHADFGDNYIYFYFKAEKWQGEPKIMEPDKCDDLIWASYYDLPEMAGHIREAIQAIGKNIYYSEYK